MTKILIFISLLLDGIIPIYLKRNSYFLPLLTITTIYSIYPKYTKKEKYYFAMLIASGILYDLLYTNLLFFNAILFFTVGLISKYIHKNFSNNIFMQIIYITLIIISYELLIITILYIFKVIPITISKIIYKISHSLILNIIYGEILYLVLNQKSRVKK